MSVEQFKNFFLTVCRDHQLDAPVAILDSIQTSRPSSNGHALDLSTHSFNAKACAVLAYCLEKDRTFQDINFSDCMLPEDGLKQILNALQANSFCSRVILKGNNIRGSSCEALGRLLKYNKVLKSLSLEWNQLGLVDTSFALFCEGLSHNGHLEILDLRNNQLSHECAKELALSLKKNVQLKVLDLRWNNVGLVGSRALLSMLESNRTLVKLELSGNNVPPDILKAIDTAVGSNEERAKVAAEHRARTDLLSRELHAREKRQKSQVVELMNRLDDQDAHLRLHKRQNLHKVGQLQELLSERKHAFESLTSKLSMTESKLALSEARSRELENQMEAFGDEREKQSRTHLEELRRERDDRIHSETKLQREISELHERRAALEAQIEDLERRTRAQKEQIFDLKEQLTNNQADLKLRQAQLDEKLTLERQKFKDDLQEIEAQKQREINRVRAEAEASEKTWRERVGKLEAVRAELEEEAGRLRNAVTAEKLRAEEQMLQAKHRIRQEEEARCHQLEEKIRFLDASKEEMAQHCAVHTGNLADNTKRLAGAKLEAENLRRRLEDLQQELANKDAEAVAEVGRVRMEAERKVQRLEAERRSKEDLYARIEQLEAQLREGVKLCETLHEEHDNAVIKILRQSHI